MARRRRYLRGKIFITNDSVFSQDNYRKGGRRVVALNNDENRLHVVKIKGLYDDKGNRRDYLIPIEHYEGFTKVSGVDPYVHKKTKWRSDIKARKMVATNVRLNKWDLAKIKHLK